MRKLPPFRVMKKRCDECLFPDSNATDTYGYDILEQCADEGRHFICHKVSALHLQEEGNICCRGFYDRDPGATVEMRLAHILNIVVFVDAPVTPE